MHPPVHILPTVPALAAFAAEQIAQAARHAVRRRGCFHLGLPGGRTALPLLDALASPATSARLPWASTHLYWSDERCVPPDAAESNYGAAEERLLRHVSLPATQVHRVPTELAPAEAALAYGRELERATGGGGLDFLVLGLGADGHTASLFPGSPALEVTDRGAVACPSPDGRGWRVSLTLAEVAAARAVRFLVAGQAKANVVAEVLAGGAAVPAAAVRPGSGSLGWWLDHDAAAAFASPALLALTADGSAPGDAGTSQATASDRGLAADPAAVEERKRWAAEAAVELIGDGMVIGLGTGSTVRYAVELLGRRLQAGDLLDVSGIPTSRATAELAERWQVPLTTLDRQPRLDLTIDGADEVGPGLRLIKGGGAALVREKIVARASRALVVVAEERKCVPMLGSRSPLPVAVLPFGWSQHLPAIRALGAEPSLRCGRDGQPVVTDDGLHIIDARFPEGIADPERVEATLVGHTGLVATGLFLGLARTAYVATPAGIVAIHRA